MSTTQEIKDIAKEGAGTTLLSSGEKVATTWRHVARPEVQAYVDKWDADCAAELQKGGGLEAKQELFRRAYSGGGNPQLKHDIAEARLLTVNSSIFTRTMMTSAFFKPESLIKNQQGIIGIRSNWAKEISARWLGVNGGGKVTVQQVESLRLIPVQITWFQVDDIEYPTFDLERGDLSLEGWIRPELERRFGVRYDVESKAILDSMLVTSGLRALFDPDKEVLATTIPDANDVDMTDQGAFTLAVMQFIRSYSLRFGMRPTNLFFNVLDNEQFYGIASQVSLVNASGFAPVAPQQTVPQSYRDAYFAQWEHDMFNLLGAQCRVHWLNGNSTCAPEPGYCYVSFTAPDPAGGAAGWAIDKPELNEVKVWQSPEQWKLGMETMSARKAGNFASAGPLQKNVLRVQFY